MVQVKSGNVLRVPRKNKLVCYDDDDNNRHCDPKENGDSESQASTDVLPCSLMGMHTSSPGTTCLHA